LIHPSTSLAPYLPAASAIPAHPHEHWLKATHHKHRGGRFERPPLGVALLLVDRSYFFFAAFFAGAFLAAAFFAGAFLAAFFVAILPILPFRWFASTLQLLIAVDECIDSCFASVKKKTNEEWKKGQQFFVAPLSLASFASIAHDLYLH
jgi:hypothetical protein